MLLQEFNPVFKLTVISEGRGGNSKTCLRGKFQEANQLNKNNRIYSKELLERETTKLQGLIDENRLVGELDHPTYDVVKLQNASHRITGLSWEGNDLIGEMELLSTPAGKVAECLLKDGVQLGISSRALGSLSPCDENEGASKVNDDLDMRTYDLVADPSVKGAFPGLTEGVQAEGKIRNVYKQVLGEKVFVSMLKESLQSLLEQRSEMDEGSMRKDPLMLNLLRDQKPAAGSEKSKAAKGYAAKGYAISDIKDPAERRRIANKAAKANAVNPRTGISLNKSPTDAENSSVDYRTTDDVRNLLSEEGFWRGVGDFFRGRSKELKAMEPIVGMDRRRDIAKSKGRKGEWKHWKQGGGKKVVNRTDNAGTTDHIPGLANTSTGEPPNPPGRRPNAPRRNVRGQEEAPVLPPYRPVNTNVDYRTTDNARDLMEAYSKKKISEGKSYRTTDDVRDLLESKTSRRNARKAAKAEAEKLVNKRTAAAENSGTTPKATDDHPVPVKPGDGPLPELDQQHGGAETSADAEARRQDDSNEDDSKGYQGGRKRTRKRKNRRKDDGGRRSRWGLPTSAALIALGHKSVGAVSRTLGPGGQDLTGRQ